MNAERGNGAFWEPGRSDEVDPTVFGRHRPLLFSVAYGMLGSVMDAEDVVQEAFLRWQRTPSAEVHPSKAYLSAVVTRLCIDQLRSARARRATWGPGCPSRCLRSGTLGNRPFWTGEHRRGGPRLRPHLGYRLETKASSQQS